MTPQDPISRAVTEFYAALECSPPLGAHEAMQRALAAYEAAQWRPISEALRDETLILVHRPLFDGNYMPKVGMDIWRRDRWWFSNERCSPTHFRPLPPPPEAAP